MNPLKRLHNIWKLGAKVPSIDNKGCTDSFVCPIVQENPTDVQPVPRKMAEIIKRKRVDPIDEIIGNDNTTSPV